jgi:uncharacterized oligopeptide transporter (OPT) family protein
MKKIMPFIVMIGILVTIAVVIKAYLNYRLKKYILQHKEVDDRMMKLLETTANGFPGDALKWGIILLFSGIGLVAIEYIAYERDSPLPYGIELIFLATGFLLYYVLQKRENDKTS